MSAEDGERTYDAKGALRISRIARQIRHSNGVTPSHGVRLRSFKRTGHKELFFGIDGEQNKGVEFIGATAGDLHDGFGQTATSGQVDRRRSHADQQRRNSSVLSMSGPSVLSLFRSV